MSKEQPIHGKSGGANDHPRERLVFSLFAAVIIATQVGWLATLAWLGWRLVRTWLLT